VGFSPTFFCGLKAGERIERGPEGTEESTERMAKTDSGSPSDPITDSGHRGQLAPEIERELEAIADHNGCELVHAEWKGGRLTLYIDREDGGVDLSDCEVVSKQVSALLDVMDFGSGRYTLEVSSPGLDRELYRPKDYARFVGSLARVTFRRPDDGAKRTVVGRLAAFDPTSDGDRATGGGTIRLDPDRGEALEIALADIEKARLEIEL
jgi:ribosome maturation factor RimP